MPVIFNINITLKGIQMKQNKEFEIYTDELKKLSQEILDAKSKTKNLAASIYPKICKKLAQLENKVAEFAQQNTSMDKDHNTFVRVAELQGDIVYTQADAIYYGRERVSGSDYRNYSEQYQTSLIKATHYYKSILLQQEVNLDTQNEIHLSLANCYFWLSQDLKKEISKSNTNDENDESNLRSILYHYDQYLHKNNMPISKLTPEDLLSYHWALYQLCNSLDAAFKNTSFSMVQEIDDDNVLMDMDVTTLTGDILPPLFEFNLESQSDLMRAECLRELEQFQRELVSITRVLSCNEQAEQLAKKNPNEWAYVVNVQQQLVQAKETKTHSQHQSDQNSPLRSSRKRVFSDVSNYRNEPSVENDLLWKKARTNGINHYTEQFKFFNIGQMDSSHDENNGSSLQEGPMTVISNYIKG